MILATAGCSNSSNLVGKSWPDFLAEKLKCEQLYKSYSCGAGNEMNIEKIKFLCEKRPDLLVVQITEPARWVWGSIDVSDTYEERPIKEHVFQDVSYYTMNPTNNVEHVERLYGYKLRDDQFLRQYVMTSKYNMEVKVLHTMLSMIYIAKTYDVRCMFFGWWDNLTHLVKKRNYERMFNDIPINPLPAQYYMEKKFKPAPCGHFREDAHEDYTDVILIPWIQENLKK